MKSSSCPLVLIQISDTKVIKEMKPTRETAQDAPTFVQVEVLKPRDVFVSENTYLHAVCAQHLHQLFGTERFVHIPSTRNEGVPATCLGFLCRTRHSRTLKILFLQGLSSVQFEHEMGIPQISVSLVSTIREIWTQRIRVVRCFHSERPRMNGQMWSIKFCWRFCQVNCPMHVR